MASTTVIVEGILMIAAVVAASIFASAFVTKMVEFKDLIASFLRTSAERARTSLVIVYAYYDNDIGGFVVYVKNVGKSSIIAVRAMDVYLGNYTTMNLYVYDTDGVLAPGEWSCQDASGDHDGIWEPGETIKLIIMNTTSINPPYIIKIISPNGYTVEEVFARRIR